jgi:hypothetical protein
MRHVPSRRTTPDAVVSTTNFCLRIVTVGRGIFVTAIRAKNLAADSGPRTCSIQRPALLDCSCPVAYAAVELASLGTCRRRTFSTRASRIMPSSILQLNVASNGLPEATIGCFKKSRLSMT